MMLRVLGRAPFINQILCIPLIQEPYSGELGLPTVFKCMFHWRSIKLGYTRFLMDDQITRESQTNRQTDRRIYSLRQ